MGRRFAAQMGAPLTAQSVEIAALEIRHDRQYGDIARQRSPRRCRHRTLRCLPGFGFRAAHADHAARFVLGLGSRRPPTASVWTATRSPLSAEAPEIRYTDSPAPIRSRVTAYPRLRSPVIAARVVCASHPVAWVRSTMDAPSARCSRSMISASLLPSRGAAVGACRPTSSRLTPFFASGRSRGCDASPGSIASCGPSSTAIAFNPAAVNLSATLRPASSRRHSGVPGFAWISRAKPSFTSLAPALLTTAPFIVSGAAATRRRKAVKTAKGWKKVIAWLKMLENQSAQQRPEDPMGAYDFTWLWRELGVGDETIQSRQTEAVSGRAETLAIPVG